MCYPCLPAAANLTLTWCWLRAWWSQAGGFCNGASVRIQNVHCFYQQFEYTPPGSGGPKKYALAVAMCNRQRLTFSLPALWRGFLRTVRVLVGMQATYKVCVRNSVRIVPAGLHGRNKTPAAWGGDKGPAKLYVGNMGHACVLVHTPVYRVPRACNECDSRMSKAWQTGHAPHTTLRARDRRASHR